MALQNWGERDQATLGAELRWHLHGEEPSVRVSVAERLLCLAAAVVHLGSVAVALFGAARFLIGF